MQYRKLGRTGQDVSIISLGAEHIEHASRETVISVVDTAMEAGVNYVDLFMASPDIRDNFGIALRGRRDRIMVAGHLGATLDDNQYFRTRDHKIEEKFIEDLMQRLKTDYIDVLMLHCVDTRDDYEQVFGPGGTLEIAQRLKKEGKARFIGMSSHMLPLSVRAVDTGALDVLMFPVNPAFDALPGDVETDDLWQEETFRNFYKSQQAPSADRTAMYHACARQGVGVVVMKVFGGGRLLSQDNPYEMPLTPAQCIHYALSQPGVCTVAAGCKTAAEFKTSLAYLSATEEEKDFSSINSGLFRRRRGICMYCNHCLPCPSEIDIAHVTRLADSAGYGKNDFLTSEYEALAAKASDCIKCGSCMDRCPFKVDIIANMERAAGIFGR